MSAWSRRNVARGGVALVGALIAPLLLLAPGGDPGAAETRPAALQGTWYPREPASLIRQVDDLLGEAGGPASSDHRVRAILVPHAAYRWSGETAAAAYRLLRGRSFERVLLLGPSHRVAVAGASLPTEIAFETPLGTVPIDGEAVARLRSEPLFRGSPEAHGLEHAVEVQLPFLQRALAPGWRLLPVLVGGLETAEVETLANHLRPLVGDATLVVVSGDFTHYGETFDYLPFPADDQAAERLRELDLGLFRELASGNAAGLEEYGRRTGITACALAPARVLAQLMPPDAEVERVGYRLSGELTGDYRHSVSYLSAVVRWGGRGDGKGRSGEGSSANGAGKTERPSEAGLAYLQALAASAVEGAAAPDEAVKARLARLLEDAPAELRDPYGVFVTLLDGGELRGCVGTIKATRPLHEAVVDIATVAALHDNRFPPVRREEVSRLTVQVSVLSAPRPLGSWRDLELGRHGVVLAKNGRSAVFLPEVAREQGWGREETLSHLAVKAGLAADAWREGAQLSVFTSRRYPREAAQ